MKTSAISKSVQFDYLFPEKQCKSTQNEFQNIVEQIVQKLDLDGLPDFEKELFLHDYMVENLSYDYEELQKGNGRKKNPAACPHAWDLVCVEGKYVHLDVTNDLNTENRKNQYSKFNFNDEQARKAYSWEDRGYPKCESMQYYYYECLNLTVHSIEELKTYVRHRKDKHSFEICLEKEFPLPDKNAGDFISQSIVQELSKYVQNIKVEFEWIPDVRLIRVRCL